MHTTKYRQLLGAALLALVLLGSLSSCGKKRRCGDCPKFSDIPQLHTTTAQLA